MEKIFKKRISENETIDFKLKLIDCYTTYADAGSLKIDNFYISNFGGDGKGRIYFIDKKETDMLLFSEQGSTYFTDFEKIYNTGLFFKRRTPIKIFLYDCEKNPNGERVEVVSDFLRVYQRGRSFYFVGENMKITYFYENEE